MPLDGLLMVGRKTSLQHFRRLIRGHWKSQLKTLMATSLQHFRRLPVFAKTGGAGKKPVAITIKIDTQSLNKALTGAPEALGQALRLAVRGALRDVQEGAREDHAFTPRSGMADRSIAVKQDGLRGSVELDTGIAPYGPMLHDGTGVYGSSGQPIRPTRAKALGPWAHGGRRIFAAQVKGIKGDSFLYRSFDRVSPTIGTRVDKAVARILKDRGL